MSDRIYLMVYVHQDDAKALTAHLYGGEGDALEGDDAEGVCHIEDIEASGYEFAGLEKAAESGIPFYGFHGEGGDHGQSMFASVNGKMIHHDRDGNARPSVSVYPENGGMIDEDAFEKAKEFLVHEGIATRLVHRKVCEYCAQTECDLNFGACDEAQAGGFDQD